MTDDESRRPIRRRRCLGRLVLALSSMAPLIAHVQPPPGKPVRIGALSNGPFVGPRRPSVFRQAMRERGWIEGRHFVIEVMHSEGRAEQLPALADELVRRHVDLIVCFGSPATAAARAATKAIPIVFLNVGDPVADGLVTSLARPGGNVTGFGGLGVGIHLKHFDLLRELIPGAPRIAMFIHPRSRFHAEVRAAIEPAARARHLVLRLVEVRSPDEIDAAFAGLAREPVDALLILGQPFFAVQAERIARLTIERRLPAVSPFYDLARAGVLMSYGSSVQDELRRLPVTIERIVNGAKPAELPVEQPMRFYLAINLKSAKAIGVTVPPSLLLRADEVIE